MIAPKYFIDILIKHDIDFFTGVPDSLLKDVCAYITDTIPTQKNIIAANEGNAVGLATGYFLATGKVPAVYMQNSGLGNCVNPFLSLIDKEVYNIPLLVLVGWRGEPGVKDEPQHIKQGKVTIPLLDTMGIKSILLAQEECEVREQINAAVNHIKKTNEPVALIVQKGTFEPYSLKPQEEQCFSLSREEAIQIVAASLCEKDIVVSTTGMISRELFEYREYSGQGHERDFLTVGSMGHASQIALGIAMQQKDRKVYCFDGDGAFLMHMGGIAIIGSRKPNNFIHIVFNNGSHDSVGGQPTVGFAIDIPQTALACGYSWATSADSTETLRDTLDSISEKSGPVLLEVKVKKGARKDLGRPTTTPVQNKEALIRFLRKE